jgi:NAD(P)-dependent dehydrogenase (short-subunit alcohol dehydrogenase family)
LVAQIRQRWGPITRLIHGAGVLADRWLAELTPEQFEQVYRTKVTALQHLLEAVRNDPLRTLAVFSSTTARLGRAGQGAYACANEVLNKMAQREARRRPGTRVIAFNWGPWDGGMVTPALKQLFASEGIGLIPPGIGGQYAAWEIQTQEPPVELVIGAQPIGIDPSTNHSPLSYADRSVASQRLSAAVPSAAVDDPAGPLAAPKLWPPHTTAAQSSHGSVQVAIPPLAENATLAFERPLSLTTHPVLADHVLDGRAVVPLALHLEWLAHAAVHRHPGLLFQGCDDLRLFRGLRLEKEETTTLQAWCGLVRREGNGYWTVVELRTRQSHGRQQLHCRANILVTSQLELPPPIEPLPSSRPDQWLAAHEYYRSLLFHGSHWHGLQQVQALRDDLWLATARPAPPPAQWCQDPLRSQWLTDPLVLDCAWQLLIIAVHHHCRQNCLPMSLGRYRQYRRHYPVSGETLILLRLRSCEPQRVRADVDFRDERGLIAQVQDCEAVLLPELESAFRRNRLTRSE